jgi:hypothetical protein
MPGYSVMEVGVMPNETIFCNNGSKLTVQWGKAQPPGCGSTDQPADPSVILTSLKAWEDPSGACGGWDVVEAWYLDGDTIAKLLPILCRASNQAYGTNLAEMTGRSESVPITVNVQGSVLTEKDLARMIRRALDSNNP